MKSHPAMDEDGWVWLEEGREPPQPLPNGRYETYVKMGGVRLPPKDLVELRKVAGFWFQKNGVKVFSQDTILRVRCLGPPHAE